MTSARFALALALALLPAGALAAPAATVAPVVSCAALVGTAVPAASIRLPTRGASVASAVERAAEGAPGTPNFVPAYCDVRGTIAPVDPTAPVITFGVALPLAWNGNAIQIGGNGLLGFVPWLAALNRDGAGSPEGSALPPNALYPLAQGYVTFGDDSGHSNGGTPPGRPGGVAPTNGQATMGGPPPMGTFEWAANREAWLNFSYQHIRKGHDATLAVMRAFYARAPRITYFMGESHGGREAMEAVGRYPEDYQGALVSVPLAFPTALWVRDFRNIRALAKPGGYIPNGKTAAIEREVVRQCDGLDGRLDGVIQNYTACNARFDPSLAPHANDALRCPGGGDTGDNCLSDAQLATLATLRAPTRLGFTVAGLGDTFPASPAGSESRMWLNGRFGPPRAGDFNPAAEIMRQTLGNPALSPLTFDPARYRDALARMSADLDAPTDWSRFFALGGKLIFHSASNDYLTNARSHIAAFEAVIRQSGPLAATRMRFYVTPGGDHGSRGFAFPNKAPQPRQMDLVGALEAWVERGRTPPDAIPQLLMDTQPPYTVRASRPLCRYPNYPRATAPGAALTCGAP